MIENEGIELGIQSIEDKGNGELAVRVKVPSDANKAQVYKDFMCNYEVTLQSIKARYQAELKAKDDQLTIYRQQSADMKEIVSLLANRPVNVHNTAESKSMNNSTDQSKNISVGGDFNLNATNSVVNLGEISGNVSNAIHQLRDSTQPEAGQLAAWLQELQGAIETEPRLKPEDKVEALEHLG